MTERAVRARVKSCRPHQFKGTEKKKSDRLEVGAVVNDSPVDCQSRE